MALSVVSSTVMAMMWTWFCLNRAVNSWRRPTRFSAKTENCRTGSVAAVMVFSAMGVNGSVATRPTRSIVGWPDRRAASTIGRHAH